jgi:hypothetical protein
MMEKEIFVSVELDEKTYDVATLNRTQNVNYLRALWRRMKIYSNFRT